MKRFSFVLTVSFLFVLLTGMKAPEECSIKDYYPARENVQYTYADEEDDEASYSIFTDYSKDGRVQLRTISGSSESIKVMEVRDGQLNFLYENKKCTHRGNYLKATDQVKEILLKKPFVVGNEWFLQDHRRRYISNLNAEVITPTGKYSAIEVTTEGQNGSTIDYYAKNIGLVKSVYPSDNVRKTVVLSKVRKNVKLVKNIKYYFLDADDYIIRCVNKKLTFQTNDKNKKVFEKAFKDLKQGKDNISLFGNAKINYMFKKGDAAYVDFNKAFIKDMNAGSGVEAMILQSITNTVGRYYSVKKVFITVNKSRYQSGHIVIEAGVPLKVY